MKKSNRNSRKRLSPFSVIPSLALLIAVLAVGVFVTSGKFKEIFIRDSKPVVLSATSQLSAVVNAGTLSTDIVDSSYVSVSSPSYSLSTATTGFTCQTITGTFGTSGSRIYVSNPGGANNGWNLTIAGTSPSATWTSGANTYNFNNASGSGCTGGQLTVDPTTATLATGLCVGCATTNVTKGSSASFVNGTTNTITIASATSGADDIADYYLTGVTLSQKIPVGTPAGTYTINLVLTATAL